MSEYAISDGYRTVDVEPVTMSTKDLDDQLNFLGQVYNRDIENLSLQGQRMMDAIILFLTEINEQAVLDDTVILKVLE